MNELVIGIVVFVSAFGAAAMAVLLRRALPEHHLSAEAKDTVKISMGLVATMTALILGLLLSSAKGTYEAQKKAIVEMSAMIVFTDRTLAMYGEESMPARQALKDAAELMLFRYWPEGNTQPARMDPETVSGETVYRALQALSPQDDEQRAIKDLAMENAHAIAQMRWLVFEQSGPSISTPLLVIVVCWLGILFFSFGLFAPPNGTVLGALFLSSVSVASAVFLIIELDQPFDGLLKISSQPFIHALQVLGN